MLGTMIGFLLMLNSMGDLSSFDIDTLRKALQQMIAGMAVSLLTTIAGLIGGILLRLEYNVADALVTDLSQTVVSFTEVSLLPLLARGERDV
jgi:biopolymer transport protein ExbB/TolQ